MKVVLTIAVTVVATVLVFLTINRFVYPLRRVELNAMSWMFRVGFGLDDGAADWLTKRQARYAPEIFRMLQASSAGTPQEDEALELAEYVLDTPGARQSLRSFGCAHSDAETVRRVADMLGSAPITSPVATSGNLSIEMMVVRQREAPNLTEEKQRLKCGEPLNKEETQ